MQCALHTQRSGVVFVTQVLGKNLTESMVVKANVRAWSLPRPCSLAHLTSAAKTP